jgi:hypothetical protein
LLFYSFYFWKKIYVQQNPKQLITMGSQAGNPTNYSVNKLQWIKFHPVWSLTWLFCLLISCFVTYKFGGYNIIHTILFLFANWFYWWIQERNMKGCDFNHGRVIAVNPTLMAVPTNMSKGGGNFPIIRIIGTKLKKIEGKPLEVGDKIATMAGYDAHSTGEFPFWADFQPEPVYLGYTNVAVLTERLKKVSQEEWNYLDSEINKISKPYQEGIYRVNPTENSWKDYPNN